MGYDVPCCPFGEDILGVDVLVVLGSAWDRKEELQSRSEI